MMVVDKRRIRGPHHGYVQSPSDHRHLRPHLRVAGPYLISEAERIPALRFAATQMASRWRYSFSQAHHAMSRMTVVHLRPGLVLAIHRLRLVSTQPNGHDYAMTPMNAMTSLGLEILATFKGVVMRGRLYQVHQSLPRSSFHCKVGYPHVGSMGTNH
jgi:hypothetical protein